MNKKILYTLFVLCISGNIFAATITANIGGGDWNSGATWDLGHIPLVTEDVVIPTGITVFSTSGVSIYNSISVSGILNISGGDFIVSGLRTITINNGGIINVTGGKNLSFDSNTAPGAVLNVNAGAILNISGGVIQTNTWNSRYIYNYGYIEVGLSINIDILYIYNYNTGTLVVHGDIQGGGSHMWIYNYGIFTVDMSTILYKTNFYNYSTARFMVFGDITLGEGSTFNNSGLVQCLNFIALSNYTDFFNTTGTLIVINNFSTAAGRCPGYSTNLGTFYYGSVTSPDLYCYTFLTSTGKIITPGRRIWLSSDFIGYGLQTDGYVIDKWFDLANNYGFKMKEDTYKPTLRNSLASNVNFNPVVSFSGGQKHMDLDGNPLFAPTKGLAMFSVIVPTSGSTGKAFICDYGLSPTNGFGFGYSTTNAYSYTPTSSIGAENQITAHGRTTKPTLLSHTTQFGVAQNQILGICDGSLSITNTTSTSLTTIDDPEINNAATPDGTYGPFTIGAASANPSTDDFEGTIAELIVYATKVSTNVKNATESFLALKYGVTLDHNYLTHDSVIYRTYDAIYKYDVAGLGREDYNFLHQRKSKSVNTGSELTVSTALIDNTQFNQKSITTDIAKTLSFLVWAHNGAALNNRIYKFSDYDFNQDSYLQFSIAGLTATTKLIVADDDAFTQNVYTLSPTSFNDPNIVYKLPARYNIDITKARYCAILTPGAASTPGVIISSVTPPTTENTAELRVYSTDKGVLLPSIADPSSIVANPPTGLIFFNSTHNRFMFNAGTPASPVWKFVGAPLSQTSAEMSASPGFYLGEIRYCNNCTPKAMWLWNGTSWKALKHD